MIDQLIDRYKNFRKQSYLKSPERYQAPLAFVGAGGHSLSNLYPAIAYFGLPLRYVVTRRQANAEQMARRFPQCQGTNDLDKVLADNELKGVMVCTAPSSHYALGKKVLQAGKHLFIEKPPCQTLGELEDLVALSHSVETTVSVQKRYATAYTRLKKELRKDGTYRMKYATGDYPEGEVLTDLFIHALDLLIFLFGPPKQNQIEVQRMGGKLSILLMTQHQSGFVGQAELSTAYSWNHPTEHLSVNQSNAHFEVHNMRSLRKVEHPSSIAGLPMEKIFNTSPKESYLYRNTGFVPLAEFNSLMEQGYAGVIQAFAEAANDGKSEQNVSSLRAMLPVYRWMEEIRRKL